MGKRGPLKKSRPDLGSPHRPAVQAGDGDLVVPPPGLTSGAVRRWAVLAPLLLDDGRLRADTREALVTYCRLADEADRLGAMLDAEGVVIDSPHGRLPNPLAKILQGVRSTMLRYGAVLGLDPASRARLESAGHLERDQGVHDDLAEFFARHGT
jgi:P27 family predicted phage terminase small subunit